MKRYETRTDAGHVAWEAMPDASATLVEMVTDYMWENQATVAEAIEDVACRGIDCEGYED